MNEDEDDVVVATGNGSQNDDTNETMDDISDVEEDDETTTLLGTQGPEDVKNISYMTFYFLGMATLLPWNFFISVNSFWNYKFRNTTTDVNSTMNDDNQTELQKEFASYLAIASNIPNAVFVILNAMVAQNINLKHRMVGSLGFVSILFTMITALAKVDSDTWQRKFLEFTLALVVLINSCTALFQGGLFGVAGKFPTKYMGAVMAGQAMGGILPALVDIAFTSVKVPEKDIGFACFLVATLFLMSSLIVFMCTRRTTFFKFYAEAEPVHPEAAGVRIGSMWPVIKKTWIYCLSVYLIFTTTLTVFPAVTVLIQSEAKTDTPSPWADKYFTPVTCFLLFNVCDYLGRILSTWLQSPGRGRGGQVIILLLSIIRTLFIPAFLFCNAWPDKRKLPVIFKSDMAYIFLMLVFGLSNGYLSNLCMLHGPKTFVSATDQEMSAMVLVACLVVGTGSGSGLSYPILSLL